MNDIGNDALIAAMESLGSAIREQNQIQLEIAASNRALTEMLGHTIDAVKELTTELQTDIDPGFNDDADDIQF